VWANLHVLWGLPFMLAGHPLRLSFTVAGCFNFAVLYALRLVLKVDVHEALFVVLVFGTIALYKVGPIIQLDYTIIQLYYHIAL
jgi:hypothetical protein